MSEHASDERRMLHRRSRGIRTLICLPPKSALRKAHLRLLVGMVLAFCATIRPRNRVRVTPLESTNPAPERNTIYTQRGNLPEAGLQNIGSEKVAAPAGYEVGKADKTLSCRDSHFRTAVGVRVV